MPDVREEILARLYIILQGIADFTTVARDLDEMPEGKRPCAILIDADETRTPDSHGSRRQPRVPLIMMMTPIIAVGVSAAPDDLGPAVSVLRGKVIAAVLGDSALADLITTNGRIDYDGLTGKLSHGSLMAGDAEIRFAIHYPLKPADL